MLVQDQDDHVQVPASGCQDFVKHGVAYNRKLIGIRFFNRDMLFSNSAAVDINWTRDTEGHNT
jgi:hypothetical protein